MPRPRSPRPNDEVTTLKLIRESVRERGYPPSQREIAEACGWASPSGANILIRVMEAKGLIRYAPGIPRGLQVTDAGEEMIEQAVPM